MCGIVGIAGSFPREQCLSVLAKMSESIVHRGPDDEGHWAQDGFGFGMRRLSIIDLAGGHQPMWDQASGLGIVYNGEMFNYREVRNTLDRQHQNNWTTHSDTEVALKSFALFGEKAIHLWNGMFAVALWDKQQKVLTLIRDRMGVKPLYYFWNGSTFLFASEVKAIIASGLVERKINKQAIWDYLTFRYVPEPDTVWQGIHKLLPGHLLRLPLGGPPEVSRYWHSDVVAVDRDPTDQETIEREFTELFLDAVELRLVAADVPVGVFLSGGLDSSAIAAAAVELGHRNFHTFSVGFEEGGDFSELSYAKQVANHVGAHYHEVVVDRHQFLELLPEVVMAADEPLADLTLVPLLSLSRLARQYVKVVLSGEGSDEILAGYDLNDLERQWQKVRVLQKVPATLLRTGAAISRLGLPEKIQLRAKKISEIPLSDWNRIELPHITRYWGQEQKQAMWNTQSLMDSERVFIKQYSAAQSSDPLQQLLSVYQKSWLVEDLLMKADKMSMAASLELRTPFLDYRLVEWANRQPNFVKVNRLGFSKYQTKDILRRFSAKRLPSEILTRPKRGFPVPAYRWLQDGLDRWASDLLLGTESRITTGLKPDSIRTALEQARQSNGDSPHRVWILIMLELWLRAWKVDLSE
jgi:asparagine synthase (glutamine-hydrolysing)